MLQAQIALDAAEKRWAAVVAHRPELEVTVAVQRRLVGRGLSLADALTRTMPVTVPLRATDVSAKLSAGTPVFIGAELELAGDAGIMLTPFVLGFCEDLTAGQVDTPAHRLGRRLDHGEIDIGSLILASLGRQQEAIRTKAHHVGVSPDLLWLVAELAAGPIAHQLQQGLPRENDSADALVTDWRHGFCPACGSWPAFAERVDTTNVLRSLRCSFCGLGWTPPEYRCIYCEETGDAFVVASPDADRAETLEMCQRCGGYLKSLAVETPTPFALLPIADLETSALDIGAAERGYGRPQMRDFPTAGAVPCPPIIES